MRGTGETDPMEGVAFPVLEGERGTTATTRAILADAARTVDPALADRIDAQRDWRSRYLGAVREVTVASGRSTGASAAMAGAGLASMRRRMVFERDGEEVALQDALSVPPAGPAGMEEIVGTSPPARELAVPYRGRTLSGQALAEQLEDWVGRGIVEPGFAAAIGRVAAHPDWLGLPGCRVAVLGAGSELGPLVPLTVWGAHVLAVDLPEPRVWKRILQVAAAGAGRTTVPMRAGSEPPAERAGLDLVRSLPEVREWLGTAAADDALVLGTYAYADRGMHVRVTAAADVLATDLLARRPDVALAYLATPTDAYLVPEAVVDASRERHATGGGRPVRALRGPLRAASRGRLFVPSHSADEAPAGWGVADGLVPQQGPNYALAKRLQRWRGMDAAAAGHRVSFNVAPASWTRSVTKNRGLGAAYAGAHHFGVEIFARETTRTLMAAMLVHDLHAPVSRPAHPEALFADNAAHGGLWRAGYEPRSVLGLAALAGLPRALRPRR